MVWKHDERSATSLDGPEALSRRALLARAGAASVALLIGGCGGGESGSSTVPVVSAAATAIAAPLATPPAPAPTPAVATAPVTRFGANCYDLFYLPFLNGLAAKDPLARLQAMKAAGIAFVRFSASGYYPNDWARWTSDRSGHLAVLDAVFAAAEKVGMPLVPCLMWTPFGLSDHLGERYSAWGNPASASRQFLASYVPAIVNRYRGSSALMMWEFANEMSDFVDLPNAEQWWPPVNVAQGTFAARTAADRLTSADVQSAYAAFAALVRSTGDTHPIGAGSGMPRYNQVENAANLWTPDTPDQFATALQLSLAGQINVLSMHLYPDGLANRFSTAGASYAAVLQAARAAADKAAATLFVGEFGVPRSGDTAADKATFGAMIAAMIAARVDYAAFWDFDYSDPTDANDVTPTNDRAWVLDLIRAANG